MDTITVEVSRDAVCAADDQVNPLVIELRVPAGATLAQFAGTLLTQDFLQFSSTHRTITGFAIDRPVIRVHSGLFRTRAEYLVPAGTSVATCIPDGRLDFQWMRS
ncbi:MAG: hypothetical protein ABW163_04465 [Luteimonas sp.]